MAVKTVNVAVAGLGFMGVTHLRAYQKIRNARIVAVCDANRVPVNGVLRGVNGNIKKSADICLGPRVKVYREYGELVADPGVEIVDISRPRLFIAPRPLRRSEAASMCSAKSRWHRMPAKRGRFCRF